MTIMAAAQIVSLLTSPIALWIGFQWGKHEARRVMLRRYGE